VTESQADKEKRQAATSSVYAAVALTGTKIAVGFATGSLGILAEAAHSALDLVAAVMTLVAVRISGRPPDRDHPYGHGKVENLSAMFETLLLLATCVWIIYSAVKRLRSGQLDIEVTFWSFAVMALSIVVDVSRSRMLYRVARKHSSQALEADALHFSTDIWSSTVVVLGLVCVKLSEWRPSLAVLKSADAVAAVIVALIVFYVCGKLGLRTIYALLDTAPAGIDERIIAAAQAVPGVVNCHQVRARYSGPQCFVDVHILVNGKQTLEQAHAQADAVEEAIREIVPGADVTVHAEPEPSAAP
jgi:cation diffusion facilitator family transporter